MIDAQEPRCGNPTCGKTLVVIAGHRRRQYCDDACKMAAHRARLAAANQVVNKVTSGQILGRRVSNRRKE